ncbi:hypothetical protein Tco_1202915 [Tanacetum coccineum]
MVYYEDAQDERIPHLGGLVPTCCIGIRPIHSRLAYGKIESLEVWLVSLGTNPMMLATMQRSSMLCHYVSTVVGAECIDFHSLQSADHRDRRTDGRVSESVMDAQKDRAQPECHQGESRIAPRLFMFCTAALVATKNVAMIAPIYFRNGFQRPVQVALKFVLHGGIPYFKTTTHECAHTYECPWRTLKRIMTDIYWVPPRAKLRNISIRKCWNLKEIDQVEKYVGGLPDTIHGSVMATKPKTMQDATEFATELMDKKINTWAERLAD